MPMSTIENTGQMVSFHVLSRQNLPSLWHSHLHVDSWCPRNSSSSASSANSATASKSILSWCLNRRKNSFYNRGAFGVGQSTNWFPPGFFQVWIFGVGCFMFKHPHDETIEKIEHFEAVLNFSVVTFFFGNGSFSKKHRWTSQICQRSADFILRRDWYVGPFAIKHPNSWSCRISTFWLKNVDKHIPNQTCRVIHHPLSYPTSSASVPRIMSNQYTQQPISAIAQKWAFSTKQQDLLKDWRKQMIGHGIGLVTGCHLTWDTWTPWLGLWFWRNVETPKKNLTMYRSYKHIDSSLAPVLSFLQDR